MLSCCDLLVTSITLYLAQVTTGGYSVPMLCAGGNCQGDLPGFLVSRPSLFEPGDFKISQSWHPNHPNTGCHRSLLQPSPCFAAMACQVAVDLATSMRDWAPRESQRSFRASTSASWTARPWCFSRWGAGYAESMVFNRKIHENTDSRGVMFTI